MTRSQMKLKSVRKILNEIRTVLFLSKKGTYVPETAEELGSSEFIYCGKVRQKQSFGFTGSKAGNTVVAIKTVDNTLLMEVVIYVW